MSLGLAPGLQAPNIGNAPMPSGTWDESELTKSLYRDVLRHYLEPTTRQRKGIEEEFQTLAALWHEECRLMSSISKMAMHSAYQRIIGLGPSVIPIILSELEKRPDHWFWALESLTGEYPVRKDEEGDVKKMATAWVRWGQQQGLDW